MPEHVTALRKRKLSSLAVLLFASATLLASCVQKEPATPRRVPDARPPGPLFEDIAREAGVSRPHAKPQLDAALEGIMPWMTSIGAAAAAADFDRDGRIDLFVTSSARGAPHSLLRNRGNGTFEDVAERAGLAHWNDDGGLAMDAIWGDVDDDGWPDLYVVRWGRDLLFRNLGDGTFVDITSTVFRRSNGNPGTDWKNGNAAVFLDYNRDGRLDIHVGNFFADHDLLNLTTTRIMHDDFERARNGGVNQLFRQEPDGTFTDVAAEAGVDDSGWTLAVGSADVDDDGWPDLYIANDFGADRLFLNAGGRFEDVSVQALGRPDTRKGMNVDFGDFDNDGWLDIYVTNITTADYLQEGNMLWRNAGRAPAGSISFADVALESGTHDGGWGWGAKFFDAENDGDLDLVSANGFISAGAESYWFDLASWTVTGQDVADAAAWPPIGDRSFSGYEPLRFWRNDALGTFTECAKSTGLSSVRDNRGIVVADFDDDGRLDLFVTNQGQEPHLFRNMSPSRYNWLRVVLEGNSSGRNKDAVGARITVSAGGSTQVRERDGGNGFSAQSDPRIHFGLGTHATADLVQVRWQDGGIQLLEDVPANAEITIRQDSSRYIAAPRIGAGAPAVRQIDATSAPETAAGSESGEQSVASLDSMEGSLRQRPAEHAPASRYRALAASLGAHERSIAFFTSLVEEHPDDLRLRIELGAALVDAIPACGGVAAVICKGRLARRSLDHLDVVVEKSPDSWVGYYVRGMNHLHWPRALRHSAAAVADLRRCIELQDASLANGAAAPPHHLRTHVALGDALARDGRLDEARRAWQHGLALFPDATSLTERLGTPDASLLEFLDEQRSLENPIDTDLSFLDVP